MIGRKRWIALGLEATMRWKQYDSENYRGERGRVGSGSEGELGRLRRVVYCSRCGAWKNCLPTWVMWAPSLDIECRKRWPLDFAGEETHPSPPNSASRFCDTLASTVPWHNCYSRDHGYSRSHGLRYMQTKYGHDLLAYGTVDDQASPTVVRVTAMEGGFHLMWRER